MYDQWYVVVVNASMVWRQLNYYVEKSLLGQGAFVGAMSELQQCSLLSAIVRMQYSLLCVGVNRFAERLSILLLFKQSFSLLQKGGK